MKKFKILPSPVGLCRVETSGGRFDERFFLAKALLEPLEKGVRRTEGVIFTEDNENPQNPQNDTALSPYSPIALSPLNNKKLDCFAHARNDKSCAKHTEKALSPHSPIALSPSNNKKLDCFAHARNDKKAAFTLAEVLITLGVIGVVAAITLAPLIHNFKSKQYEIAFKKTNSVLENAIANTCFEFGFGDLGKDIYDKYNGDNISTYRNTDLKEINDYFVSQLKYVKKYVYIDKTVYNKNIYHYSPNEADVTYRYHGLYGLNPYNHSNIAAIYILPDGSAITAMSFFYHGRSDGCPVRITIDTNGPEKRPNRIGYDIFPICYNSSGKTAGCNNYGAISGAIAKYQVYGCAKLNQYPEDKSKSYWKNLK